VSTARAFSAFSARNGDLLVCCACRGYFACGSREGTCGAGFDERTRWAWTSYSGSGGASWWWTLHVACIMSVLRRAGCCTSQCESGFVLRSETHNQNSLRQPAKQEAHPPWRLDLNDRARFGHEPHDDLTHFPYTRAQLRIHAHVHAHQVNPAWPLKRSDGSGAALRVSDHR
jgi:hypothetical protein